MDTAPPSSSAPAVSTWPRSAQFALVFLLGVAAALLAVHGCRGLRGGSRPTELNRGALATYRIDLNRTDRAELLQVPGVGNNLARRIQDYAGQHGPFQNLPDLKQVKGVGPMTLERWEPWLTVKPAATERDPSPGSASGRKTAGKKGLQPGERIDLNRASAAELQRLPGIGPKRAQLILEERQKRPFASIEDLRRISGIGPKIMEQLRPFVTVESSPTQVVTGGGY